MATLPDLLLAPAPPITRPPVRRLHRPRGPAVALVVLGAALVVGPIVGGLFSQAASGRQLLDAFRPHLQADALARYQQDLLTLRDGSSGVDTVYAEARVAPGRFPGIDTYRQRSAAINQRAAELLARIQAAEPDYRKVDAIGGFDRVPFLIVAAGLALLYGGGVLVTGSNGRARAAAPFVVLASAVLLAYPFLSNLRVGSQAGHRLLASLAPAMTPQEVSQMQTDFVVLVTAEGQLETAFRAVPKHGAAAKAIATLDGDWPTISSDLATLVGTINDNITNYQALVDLDRLGGPVSGLVALPGTLVGVGAVSAGLATAARPRRRKEHT